MRGHKWLGLLRATLLVAAGSCLPSRGPAPPPLAAPLVTVERDTYRVRRTRDGSVLELTIVATFTNRSADTVVLHPCINRGEAAVALDKWVDGEWRSAFDHACVDVLDRSAPRLAPGQSRTDTVTLSASLRPNVSPHFEFDAVPGLYRVVYWKAWRNWISGRPGGLLPKELRVSNAFRVVE